MWYKFNIRFNSSVLSTFFAFSAIGFTILLGIILNISIETEKIANLKQNETYVMKQIAGAILGSAELDAQGLEQQSDELMQDYLNYLFQNKNNQINNVIKVGVYSLNPNNKLDRKKLLSEWDSNEKIEQKCIDKKSEYFLAPKSNYTYFIDLTLNKCANSNMSMLEYHTLTMPILVSLMIIFIWGICIYVILKSVSYADSLLGSSENTHDLLYHAEKIKWTNVRILAQRALQVRGKNLQYYQTLVLDTQHDIAKILDTINQTFNHKDLNHNVSIIRGIIQKLAIEVRSSESPFYDVTTRRELHKEEILKLFSIYFPSANISDELPSNFFLLIQDISIFERILVNLSSNALKHTEIRKLRVRIYLEDNIFKLRIFSNVSLFNSIKLHLAKITNRIDLRNPENPVYIKLLGRTGRGLSIVKRGITKLGGSIIFSIDKKVVVTGIDLPSSFRVENKSIEVKTFIRKRVLLFKNEELNECARNLGLENFIINRQEFNSYMEKNIPLELVTDEEVTLCENCVVRILTKKERLHGIALNWLSELKSPKLEGV